MRNIKPIVLEITVLIFILLLGLFLYLYKIDQIPSGIYADEAVTGYNVYSISKTGKDENGKTLPVAMRFLGSYTPPLYTYLSVPLIASLDLNVTSTRFISALSGFLSILVVFLLLKSLQITKSKVAPLLGSLLFAIAPWTVFFSRVGYEMNLAFFIFSLTALLIWYGIKKHPLFLTFGVASLSLATYADFTQRILAPIFLAGLIFLFHKEIFIKKNKRYLFTGLLLAFLIQIPNLTIITTPVFFTKSNLFYTETIVTQAEKIAQFLPMFIAIPLAFLREFLSEFITYFSPRSLFFLPDPDLQRSLPELSVFYQWMIIPYLAGLYFLFKERGTAFRFILLLALITPIPSSLTGDPFHVQRTLPLLLPLILIIAIGVDRAIYKIPTIAWFPIFSLIVIGSLILLWRSYFVFLPKERAKVWGYGWSQLAEEIKKYPDKKFVIDQPKRIKPENLAYVQLTFFLKFPPENFQQTINPVIKENYYTNIQFDIEHHFGNIETRAINWADDVAENKILVGDEFSISKEQAEEHSLIKIFDIRDPLNQIIFEGFEFQPKSSVPARKQG